MWYICTMKYYSAIRRSRIVPSVETWMSLESAIQCEVRKPFISKYRIMLLICGISKNGIDELIGKVEIESQMQKTNLCFVYGNIRKHYGNENPLWKLG